MIEDLGEGYHRDTNVEKTRAAAAVAKHLKQKTRFKMSLKRMKAFIEKHGHRGVQVFRFEWRRYKRLLQTRARYKWVPRKMETDEFFARVYREDDMAADSFCSICRREDPVDPVEKDSVNNQDLLRDEYLRSTLEKGKHLSVTQEIKRVGPDGKPVVEEKAVHFTLLETSYGSHRPKQLAVSTGADTTAIAAHLGLQVILEERWVPDPPPAVVEGSTRRYLMREPRAVWVRPQDIGPHEAWYRNCKVWEQIPSDLPDTIMVHAPRRVVNTIPYLDPKCPTLPITWALKRAGWKGTEKLIVHVENRVGEFDSYVCTKAKRYYQVLLELRKCLALTSSIPSRQPMLFYQLLLHSQRVEPELGNVEYTRLWKGLQNKGMVPLMLEPPEEEEELEPMEDLQENDDMLVGFGNEPPKQKLKRKRPPQPSTGHGGGHGGGGEPLPVHVPPGVPPLPPPVEPPPPGPGAGGVSPPFAEPPPPVCDDVLVPIVVEEEDEDDDGAKRRRGKRDEIPWFLGLDGLEVRYDGEWADPVSGKKQPNWQIRCNRCPKSCMKTRGVTPQFTKTAGAIEPIAFLHVWVSTEKAPNRTHRRTNPSDADVQAYALERREELLEVLRRGGADR